MVSHLDLANHVVSATFLCSFLRMHTLVSFSHSLDLFVDF